MKNVEKLKKCPSIDSAVREYIVENTVLISDEDVDNYINAVSFKELLTMYLNWVGIYGYTENIYNFFEVFVADLITEGSNNE